MAEVVSTIKASGGDYTSLASWWADVYDSANPEQTAEVYSGVDAGGLTWSAMPNATVTASAHPIIRGASGHRHEGKIPSSATDVAYANGQIGIADSYYEIDGMYLKNNNKVINVTASKKGWAIKNCILHDSSTTVHNIIDWNNWSSSTTLGAILVNNIWVSDATSDASSTELISLGANNTWYATIYNNTVYCGVDCIGIKLIANLTSSKVVGYVYNNAVFVGSGGACYAENTEDTTLNLTGVGYNAGSDATATSLLGGSGNEDSLTDSSQFVDEESDWNLLGTADLVGAGTTTYSATDAVGTTWEDPPSMGALEYVSAEIETPTIGVKYALPAFKNL